MALNMKESEIPKYLAEELSKEPYNLNLNLISFTSLQGDALMRVFQSVLSEIQPKLKDVFSEGSPSTKAEKVEEMMELLRILKFWPKCFDKKTLRSALETTNQEIIWDTLGWILTRKEELKKRAYLSTYLVKITVPPEYQYDSDLQQVYQEYLEKILEFKQVHKKLEEIQRHKGITELVQDLKAVEGEVDSCSRKLDKMKCTVVEGSLTDIQGYLKLAGELRMARTEKGRMINQLFVEERKMECLENKEEFLKEKLREMKELNAGSKAEGLLQRTEQDCDILRFIVSHKIPQDMEEAERKIKGMRRVLEGGGVECLGDLEEVREKIRRVRREVEGMEGELKGRDSDARVVYARQKANENRRRKMELLEELEERRREMMGEKSGLRERREQQGPLKEMMVGRGEFKEYVKGMKVKAARWKGMRREMEEIEQEKGVMVTTKSLVEEELRESIEKLRELEEQYGLVGFSCVQEKLEKEKRGWREGGMGGGDGEEGKMRYIYELSEKGRELMERIKGRKVQVEPLCTGVIEAKQEVKTLELHGKRLQNKWEGEMGPVMESNRRFEARIEKVKEEIVKSQEEIARLTGLLPVLKVNVQRAKMEAELLKDNPTSNRSFKNRVLTRIVDQERLQKKLNGEMGELEETQQFAVKQNEQWFNLKRLLEMKMQVLLRGNRSGGESSAGGNKSD